MHFVDSCQRASDPSAVPSPSEERDPVNRYIGRARLPQFVALSAETRAAYIGESPAHLRMYSSLRTPLRSEASLDFGDSPATIVDIDRFSTRAKGSIGGGKSSGHSDASDNDENEPMAGSEAK